MAGAASVLSFDPGAHVYALPDGRVVPSVTKILSAVGVSVDFDQIGAMSSTMRERIDWKRELGTAVHADCHAWDDDDLALESVHAEVRPYVDAWITFRANTGFVPDTRERRVYHSGLFYCGTLDAIGALPNGRRVLVDIKTGDPEDAGARFQTAAYREAYLADHATASIDERWSVQLCPDNAIPYRIHPYADWTDFSKFAAFVTTFHEQACRRRNR